MSSLHCRAQCLSLNAFSSHNALYSVFQHAFTGSVVRHAIRTPHLSSTNARHKSTTKTKPTGDGKNGAKQPEDVVKVDNASRLLETLRALRQRNRNKLIRRMRRDGNAKTEGTVASIDDKAREIHNEKLKLHYVTKRDANVIIRPQTGSSRPSYYDSPFQRFQRGEPVFTDLIFAGGLKGQTIVAKNISPDPDETVLDYEGHPCEPVISRRSVTEKCEQPWLSQAVTLTGLSALEQEMQDFCHYVIPSEDEMRARSHVVEEVRSIVRRFTKKNGNSSFSSQVFGSLASGFSLATSDIDIRLVNESWETKRWAPSAAQRHQIYKALKQLAGCFRRDGFGDVELVHARYPLVSMTHKPSGITVQVVASNAENIQTQLLRTWRTQYPEMLPLFTTIKSCLQLRGLTNVFNGGLSSYPLLLMIRTSLKLAPGATLAEQLMNFLSFFGNLDTRLQGIGPDPFPRLWDKVLDRNDIPALQYPNSNAERYVHAFFELSAANPKMPFLLCVQDPTDKHTDVSRKCFAWKHIAATFNYLHDDLKDQIKQSESGASSRPLLFNMLGFYHAKYAQLREPAQRLGSQLATRNSKDILAVPFTVADQEQEESSRANAADHEQETASKSAGSGQDPGAVAEIQTARQSTEESVSIVEQVLPPLSQTTSGRDVDPINLAHQQQFSPVASAYQLNGKRGYSTSARAVLASHSAWQPMLKRRPMRSKVVIFNHGFCRRNESTKIDFDLPDIPETRKDRRPSWARTRPSALSEDNTYPIASNTELSDQDGRSPVDSRTQIAQAELEERYSKFDAAEGKDGEQDWSDLFVDLPDDADAVLESAQLSYRSTSGFNGWRKVKFSASDVYVPKDESLEDDVELSEIQGASLPRRRSR